ncbi:MAG: hypothetical protein KDD02_11565 [Phaeodactylibacter sp.]|nr:hypothetical protein [Phaeodactylibacter sp.]MCB9300757.1 hypothetical protein [Lewinellaceae bacterium]
MKKHTACLNFLFFLILSSGLSAQEFWSEDFEGGGIPAEWSNEDASGNGALWVGCFNPNGCPDGEDFPAELWPFTSTSAANGFAVLNSGSYGNLPGPGHISRLTTPPINCSTSGQVFLQFQTAIGTDQSSGAEDAILRVITPGGTASFEIFPMLKEDDGQYFVPVKRLAHGQAYYVTLDISSLAAGQDSVYLQWEWKSEFQFAWCIDDVLLSSENPAQPEGSIWFESFSNGINNWASNPLSIPDSNWLWKPGGDVSNALSANAFGDLIFIHSQTGNDGAMAFNADFYNTQGQIPTGPIRYYVCELISPSIDLSEVDNPVAVQFSQLAWLGNIAPGAPQTEQGAKFIASLSYSTDGGQSWSEPINVNPYLTPVTSYNAGIMPPASNTQYVALPDAAGSPDFRIKFTWAADLYFWVLDDIAIVQRPALDMKANRNFFAVLPNAMTPQSQLEDEPLLADVVNQGGETASDVRLEAFIRRKADGAVVHQDTLYYGNISVDSLVENNLFGGLLEAESLASTGDYEGFYAVGHSQPDGRPQDDTIKWRFLVTDTTFAKELGPTRDIASGDNFNYTFGNCFYVPNGAGWFARYISFGVANANQLHAGGKSVTLLLYKWEGDLNEDGLANKEEYPDLIAFNSYFFQGDESGGLITVPVSEDNMGKPLEDDAYYLAVVSYDVGSPPFIPCFMLASDTIDYQACWFAHNELGRPQYGSILKEGLEEDFSLLGFGYNIVPVVRLHIGNSPILLAAEEPGALQPRLQLVPNPAGDWVQVTFPDDGRLPTGSWLKVSDMSGSIVFEKKLGIFTEKRFTFDARQLAPGYYSIQLITPVYTTSAPLIINR